MSDTYGYNMGLLLNSSPPARPSIPDVHSPIRCFLEIVTLAAQAAADRIFIARVPKGAKILGISLNASATLGGTAEIAIGIAGATGKYRASAIFTTANAWVESALNSAVGVALTADEDIFITVAAASLPGSGTLRVKVEYLCN